MIDIHTHVIPNVDDGSKSLEDSIAMIKHEVDIGVKVIYATPHHIYRRYEKSVDEIKKQYNLLVEEVKRQGIDVEILLGQEIYYTTRENILEKLDNGELLTMNNSRYVLLEFSFTHEPEDIADLIYNFNVHNYKVIIAHVERYKWITLDIVRKMKSEGALIQINADSRINKSTLREYFFTKKLLRNNLVDLLASDTHSFRVSNLDKAMKKIKNDTLVNQMF